MQLCLTFEDGSIEEVEGTVEFIPNQRLQDWGRKRTVANGCFEYNLTINQTLPSEVHDKVCFLPFYIARIKFLIVEFRPEQLQIRLLGVDKIPAYYFGQGS